MCTMLCFFFSSRRRHTRCSRDWSSDVCSSDLVARHRGATGVRLLAHPTLAVALAGRGAWIVMVLLLDELAVFNAKCVEGIKRLAVREANLGLPGNPAAIAGVVMQEFKAADCGQDAGEKIEERIASAYQHTFAACRIEWSAQRRILGPRNSRHVFRRDAIEVRLHTLLSLIVVHSRFSPIWALAELAGSPDSSGNFRHQPLSSVR